MVTDARMKAKVNMLGLTMVVFTLFALPVFNQVKEDTRESAKEVSQTLLAQLYFDVQGNFKIETDGPIDAVDAWQKQAQKENPNCTLECDPKGDPDGDGLTTEEELAQDRNPMCNEDVKGEDYCKEQSTTELPDEDEKLPVEGRTDELFNQVRQPTSPPQESVPFSSSANYDRFVVYMNTTWSENGFNVTVRNSQQVELAADQGFGGLFAQPQSREDKETIASPPMGQYTVVFRNLQDSGLPTSPPPQIHVIVFGVLDAKPAA